jgi:hypothetical protein
MRISPNGEFIGGGSRYIRCADSVPSFWGCVLTSSDYVSPLLVSAPAFSLDSIYVMEWNGGGVV